MDVLLRGRVLQSCHPLKSIREVCNFGYNFLSTDSKAHEVKGVTFCVICTFSYVQGVLAIRGFVFRGFAIRGFLKP